MMPLPRRRPTTSTLRRALRSPPLAPVATYRVPAQWVECAKNELGAAAEQQEAAAELQLFAAIDNQADAPAVTPCSMSSARYSDGRLRLGRREMRFIYELARFRHMQQLRVVASRPNKVRAHTVSWDAYVHARRQAHSWWEAPAPSQPPPPAPPAVSATDHAPHHRRRHHRGQQGKQ